MVKRILFDKNDAFTLRGWCILLIILHHLVLFFNEKYGVTMPRWCIELRDLGYAVVGTFFMLSGYGVYHSVIKNRPLSFHYWVRRLLKLYLPFVFVVLVISALQYYISNFKMNELWQSLYTLTLPTEETWFLKTIFVFHVVTYALLGYLRRPRVALTIISLLTVIWMLVSDYALDMWSHWWKSLWCFPFGLWLASCREQLKKWDRPIVWLIIAAVLLICYSLTFFSRTHYCPETLKFYMLPWVYNLVSVSFALMFIKFVPYLGTRSRLLNYCGRNSLTLYLGHVGLLLLFSPNSMWTFAFLVIVVAFIITAVFEWLNRHLLYRLTE